uniref:Uncharacterized protein n=1 Tax=Arundo donax TaxID=35708 RepID=A0A0A9HIY8_ARUDO
MCLENARRRQERDAAGSAGNCGAHAQVPAYFCDSGSDGDVPSRPEHAGRVLV